MSKKIHQLDTSQYQDKKLIAFDLYGTCIHRPEWIFHKSFTIDKDLKNVLETNPIEMDQIEKGGLVIDWVEVKLNKKILNKVKKDIAWILLYPEFLDTIQYLKSKWYRTAVVSNLAKPYEEPLKELIPQWTFDYSALSFEVWAMKPDYKIFEYLKNSSSLEYDEMVFVWDSMWSDIIWSWDLWMKPIHINRRHKLLPENMEKRWINYIQISTLDQLKDIL